jgi:hypothetical protein
MRKRLRKKPAVRWQIVSTDYCPVIWNDGKRDWISWELLGKTSNRIMSNFVVGHDLFYTRQAAERAIGRLPFALLLERFQKGKPTKSWQYFESKRAPAAPPRDPFLPGEVASIRKGNFSICMITSDPWAPRTWLPLGSLVMVLETSISGSIVKILTGNETGWLESRFLDPFPGEGE